MGTKPQSSRWFPSHKQLDNPKAVEGAFRQLLQQHYALQDKFDTSQQAQVQRKPSGPPPGSGPADSMLLGLRVAPVDTQKLANGAVLKFVKAQGNFQFL